MKASVVIPTKNGGTLFPRVLDAVLAQETPWSFDVLVVDSGSTDGTLEVCCRRDRVKLHRIQPEEFGHGRTRNLGISLTKGEFAVLITQDAMPANNQWLYELIEATEQAPDIAGTFGRHIAYPEASPFTVRALDNHFDGFLSWPAVARMDDPERYQRDQGYRQVLHFFSDNNSCLRRAVWEKEPFPDVDFAEDQIWAKRVIEAGYAKAYANHAIVYHSHDFGFWEQGQRSYDESRAFKRSFGYHLCPTFKHLFAQSCRTTLADLHYAIHAGITTRNVKWLLRSPLQNFFRQIGFYLGQRADELPQFVPNVFSRETKLRNRT